MIFFFYEFLHFLKAEMLPNHQISEPLKMAKTAVLELLEPRKLILREICETEK